MCTYCFTASPSSTIHHLPGSEETPQGINSNRLIHPSGTAATVVQLARPTTIASKTSVSSTTGRIGKEGHGHRRSVANSSEIMSRSSPSGSVQQPDTTGVD